MGNTVTSATLQNPPGMGLHWHVEQLPQRALDVVPSSSVGITIYNLLMSIIEIENLNKSYRVYQKQEGVFASIRGLFRREYREIQAVRNINFSVEQGEFVAFLGPNGAGKTTTLKLLSGVINPTTGNVRVLGHVPWHRENQYRRRFALVMGQKNQLWWDLPAIESFRLNQQIYAIPVRKYEQTRNELTELLDVAHLLRQPVRELSLGERMKMELIAALLHQPEVLFLDEPTIGLDVVAQHKIQQFLSQYQRDKQNTILLTSHYMKDIEALCKRVVIIANGSIYHDGSLAEIIDRFSGDKIVTLDLADAKSFADLQSVPNLIEANPPRIRFRVPRDQVGKRLSEILSKHAVDDIEVEDPPLEEVISKVFSEAAKNSHPEPLLNS
jgi:ABC-2 type transport system ATP-binding protein